MNEQRMDSDRERRNSKAVLSDHVCLPTTGTSTSPCMSPSPLNA